MTPMQWAGESRSSLPRGRHSLSRDEVAKSQRDRLLRAMTDECAERGFADTTAAGVYQRAGVSSRAFYEHFRDVRACFLAAYDASVDVTLNALGSRGSEADPLAQLSVMLQTYLELLASEPEIARTFLIEVYGAGPTALARRLEVHQRFVAAMQSLLSARHRLTASDRRAVESLVGAITFQVTTKVMAGDFKSLVKLRDPLLDSAVRLCPWLVADESADEPTNVSTDERTS